MADVNGTLGDDILVGTAGDDVIRGFTGNDSIDAGDGDDLILPGSGNNTIDGGFGIDRVDFFNLAEGMIANLLTGTILGTMSGDTSTVVNVENLYGSNFDDVLTGDDGHNLIVGRDGNDTIVGNGGDDTLRGNSGIDTLDYTASTDGVTVNLVNGSARFVSISQGFDSVFGFEILLGSDFADILTSSYDGEEIYGNAGDDALEGRSGNDTFYGGDDDDLLRGRDGDDILFGGSGNDLILDGDGTDTVDAGDGDDRVIVGSGDGAYDGGAGSDLLDFSSQSIALDVDLRDGSVRDTGLGMQSFVGFEEVRASSGGGRYFGTSGDNILRGNVGDDRLLGVAGNDIILGAAGDDTILPGIGLDIVNGGSGKDIVSYEFQTDGLTLSLTTNTGFDTAMTGLIDDSYSAVEGLIGGEGDDFVEGDDGDNIIGGWYGTNEVYGYGGNDTIILGQNANVNDASGTQIVDGGDGIDLADYSWMIARPFEITIAASGTIITRERESNVLIEEIDNVESVRGSRGVDGIIIKSTAGHLVDGFEAQDDINSLDGSDVMIGGDGNDEITDSQGSDILAGNDGDDILTLLVGGNVSGEANLLLGGAGNDVLHGGETDDILFGGDGDDMLTAGYINTGATAGNQPLPTGTADIVTSLTDLITGIFAGMGITGQADTDIDLSQLSFSTADLTAAYASTTLLAGGALELGFDTTDGFQTDILDGGAGNDTFDGANENSVIFNGGEGDDTIDVNRARNFIAMGGEGNDTIEGRVNNTSVVRVMDGGDGADTLIGTDSMVGEVLIVGANGTATADTADGGAGNDRLIAHMDTGLSELTGGSGDDVFELHDAAQTVTITDFLSGDDLVQLEVGGAIIDFADLVANFLTAPDTISVGGLTATLTGVDIAADLSDADFIFA